MCCRRLRDTPELLELVGEESANELALQERLRQRFDDVLVRAALSLAEARRKAEGLLPEASRLWLTRVAVEQATHPAVAAHKAGRFPRDEPVLDLCCGIGSDAAALIRRGPVTVVDRDEAMLQRCLWNLDVWQCAAADSAVADVCELPLENSLVHAGSGQATRRSAAGSPPGAVFS